MNVAERSDPRRRIAGLIALAALIGGFVVIALATSDDGDGEASSGTASATGAGSASGDGAPVTTLQLSFPSGWVADDLEDTDSEAGLLAAAAHAPTGATFLARTVVGKLDDDVRLPDLAAQVEEGMKSSLEGFELVDRETTEIAGVEAISLEYTQRSGETQFRSLMVIVPLDVQVLYLTARAPGDGLDDVEDDVDRLMASAVRDIAGGG